MAVEGKYQGRLSHRLVVLSIKTIPVALALLSMLTTVLDYMAIDTTLVNYLILGSLIGFMYLASYVFRFCLYHRMFLHYFVGMNLISIYDAYIGIPVSNYHMLQLYLAFTGICLIVALVLHVRDSKGAASENSQQH